MRSITFPRLQRSLGVLVLIALVLVGCKGKQTGTVSGKVTFKGKPLTSGEVQFINPEKGAGSSGQLDSSGNYTLAGQLEAGKYKVYIQPPTPEQLPPGKVSTRPPFDVPPKFQDPSQTPISKDVKVGPNDIPIEID